MLGIRWLVALASVTVMALIAGCGTHLPPASVQHDTTLAEQAFQEIAAGQDSQVTALFDSKMASVLTAAELAQAWSRAATADGTLGAEGSPKTFYAGGDLVVDVPLRMARGSLTGRLSFNTQGQIAGLFFLK